LISVTNVIQNEYMPKDATITVRVPQELKQRLARRARREHRSISAQVLRELELAVAREAAGEAGVPALGLFKAARLPTEKDFDHVRSVLWGRLGTRGE
jgi:predicted transcriptional regulator